MQVSIKQILETSPEYFAQEVFGLRMSQCHRDMMTHIEGDGDRLLLCQRGLGKSRVLQAFIGWYIITNPNKRVILVSDSDGKAKSFLRVIKNTLETSQIIKDNWGDIKGSIWTEHELTMANRDVILPEASLQAIGSGSGQATGKHCDLCVCDDLISFDSTRIQSNREKTRDWFLTTLTPCLQADARFICCGTRYHGADLYQNMIDDLDFNTLILPSIKDDGNVQCEWLRPLEDVVKDDRVVLKGLKTLKRLMGSVIYALQYDNSTRLLMEGNIIRAEWLQYYQKLSNIKSIIISCDPAISQKESADKTAITIFGKDPENQIYLIDYVNEHLTFNATINKLESLAKYYNPEAILIEQVAYQESLIQECKRKIMTTVIKGIPPKGDKESRLRSVSPLFENERVFFKRSQHEVVDNLLMFPNVVHDDLVDAVSLGLAHYTGDDEGCVIF